MNILGRWIFDSIDLNNLEVPNNKTGYVLVVLIPRIGLPYQRWLKSDDNGMMYLPEQKCIYMQIPQHANVFYENTAIPMARMAKLE